MYYSDLGYPSYGSYLKGKEWADLHEFFYQKCGPYQCKLCGQAKELVLHKRSYQYLTLRKLYRRFLFTFAVKWYLRRKMIWLCHACHAQMHFYDDGERVPTEERSLKRREFFLRVRNFLWRTFT
jgi:hypothetical protein